MVTRQAKLHEKLQSQCNLHSVYWKKYASDLVSATNVNHCKFSTKILLTYLTIYNVIIITSEYMDAMKIGPYYTVYKYFYTFTVHTCGDHCMESNWLLVQVYLQDKEIQFLCLNQNSIWHILVWLWYVLPVETRTYFTSRGYDVINTVCRNYIEY